MISHRKSKEVINIAWFGRTSHPFFKKKWHKTDIFPVLQKLTHMCSLYCKSKSELETESVSQWVTRSPIELFWTAKNSGKFMISFWFVSVFCFSLSKFLPDASGQNTKFPFFLTVRISEGMVMKHISIRSNSHFHCIFTSLNCEEAATKWVEANGGWWHTLKGN